MKGGTISVNELLEGQETEQEKYEYIQKYNAACRMEEFNDTIADSVCIPTGFEHLDEALCGGLHDRLYILEGESSVGKTTFAMQLAEQVARSGEDALILSYQEKADTLMAKRVSYLAFTGDSGYFADEILGGRQYQGYSSEEKETVQRAIATFQKRARNLYIIDGMGGAGTREISGMIQDHIRITRKRPAVFVDHIQAAAWADGKEVSQLSVFKAALGLKRVAEGCGVPIVAISCMDEEVYDMSKCPCGALIRMQPCKIEGCEEEGGDDAGFFRWKENDLCNVRLTVLRNSHGPMGEDVDMGYNAAFNFFVEDHGHYIPRNYRHPWE